MTFGPCAITCDISGHHTVPAECTDSHGDNYEYYQLISRRKFTRGSKHTNFYSKSQKKIKILNQLARHHSSTGVAESSPQNATRLTLSAYCMQSFSLSNPNPRHWYCTGTSMSYPLKFSVRLLASTSGCKCKLSISSCMVLYHSMHPKSFINSIILKVKQTTTLSIYSREHRTS